LDLGGYLYASNRVEGVLYEVRLQKPA